MKWEPIETVPEGEYVLVSLTFNLGAPEAGTETVMWVDSYLGGGHRNISAWFAFPSLIWVPLTPTHWMPLPEPPTIETERR